MTISDKLYESIIQFESKVRGTELVLSNSLSLSSFNETITYINDAESAIPEKDFNDFHFGLIGNPDKILEYFKTITTRNNILFESVKSKMTKSEIFKLKKIVDIFELKVANQKTRLFESYYVNEAEYDPSVTLDASTAAKELLVKPLTTKIASSVNQSSVINILKDVINALTENMSVIGITQLILDIIGLVGDPLGFGAVADLLNAIIYFARGKVTLGIISLVAMIPGIGDVGKIFKPIAKEADLVLKAAGKGSDEVVAVLAKVPVKKRGLLKRLINAIVTFIPTILGNSAKLLAKGFDAIVKFFESTLGKIPFVGKYISKAFTFVFEVLSKQLKKLESLCNKIVDNIGGAIKVDASKMSTRAGTQYTQAQIESVMKAFDSEIVSKGGHIIFDTKSGLARMVKSGETRAFATVPIDILAKQPSFLGAKYGAKLANTAASLQLGTGKYLATLADPHFINSVNDAVLAKAIKWISPKFTKFLGGKWRFSMFLGKQIVKYMNYPAKDNNKLYSDEELGAFGSAALNSYINDKIKKEKAASGATYIPALTLDSKDKEVFDKITQYQNTYAKMYDQPELITVAYSKFKNEAVESEFKELWDAIGKGEITRPETKPADMKSADLKKDLDLTKPEDQQPTGQSTQSQPVFNPNNQMGRFGMYESGIISSFSQFKKIK